MLNLPDNEKIKRQFLLDLPKRKWNCNSEYDYLFIVPTNEKHDSGFKLIAIVGAVNTESGSKAELAAFCDDICWSFPKEHPYGKSEARKNKMILRTDCLYPSNILRMWASSEHYFKGRFRVGFSLSSTEVELFVVPRGDGVNKVTGEIINV